jgi:hypothetical protein
MRDGLDIVTEILMAIGFAGMGEEEEGTVKTRRAFLSTLACTMMTSRHLQSDLGEDADPPQKKMTIYHPSRDEINRKNCFRAAIRVQRVAEIAEEVDLRRQAETVTVTVTRPL